MQDQWARVLIDLEELGNKEFRPDRSVHYWNHFLLPPSHQTNNEGTQVCSEDHLSVSRIRSHHLLLGVSLLAERRIFSLFSTVYAWSNWAPGSKAFHVLSRLSTVNEDDLVVEELLGFALAVDRHATRKYFRLQRKYFRLRFKCFLHVVVVLYVDCSLHVRFWPMNENCLCSQMQF